MRTNELSEREWFVIGEALALASAYAHRLPLDCQFQNDREEMDDLLTRNFPPDQVAFHSIHAAFATGICVDPYFADGEETQDHQVFLRTLVDALDAINEAEAAA